MSEFEAKLVQSTIREIKIKTLMESNQTFNLEASYSASIHDPKDNDDSTVLVKIKTEMSDPDKEKIVIECDSEMFFELNCVPDNYAKLLIAQAQETIQTVITDKITNILQIMGYSLVIE